jgi:hypothetical protein
MYQTINLHQFRQAFKEVRPNNFSYEGLEVLFNYLTDLEDSDSSFNFELDVIAFCCDFAEESIENIIEYYSIDCGGLNEEETKNYVKKFLEDATEVAGFTDSTIVYHIF